jgi:hypothetical protein
VSRATWSVLTLALGLSATAVSTTPAQAHCVRIGIYADDPARTVPALKRTVGDEITVISVYLTGGRAIPGSVISAANDEHSELLVSWEPDDGAGGPDQPRHRLKSVIGGTYDASLRALVKQLAQVRAGAILRAMPEMNTPWHAWSGTVNGNTPSAFVRAWKHVRAVIESTKGGSRIQMLWSPYAWSTPDNAANAIARYFPGRSEVDLVGADGYNFGNRGDLTWTDPGAIFGPAYKQIESLADRPFWIAETGSTADGGDKAGWILSLSTLQSTSMPKLAGLVWYDVDDPLGDFRLRGRTVNAAFRDLVEEGCR